MDFSTIIEILGVVLLAAGAGLGVGAVWPALLVLGAYCVAVGYLGDAS